MESSIDEGFEVPSFEPRQPGVSPRLQATETETAKTLTDHIKTTKQATPLQPPLVFPRSAQTASSLETSTLPPWAIAVLTLGALLCFAGLAGLLLAAFIKSRRTLFLVFGIVLLCCGLVGIGATLGVTLGARTASGLSAGSRMESKGTVSVVTVNDTPIWYFTPVSSNGEVGTRYVIADAGLNVSMRSVGNGTNLPPPNVPISASFYVAFDGRLVFESWKLLSPSSLQRSAIAGTRKIAAYRITFDNNDCGNPRNPCQPTCSADAIQDILIKNPMSMKNFYKTVSLGQFILDSADVYEVTLPGATGFNSLFSAIQRQLGPKQANYHILFLPPQYSRDVFVGNVGGLGEVGGSVSWIKSCSFPVVAHESAHNFGLMHSTAVNNDTGQLMEYADYSSVMGSGYLMALRRGGWVRADSPKPVEPGLGWVGLAASQIQSMGWLPSDAVLNISSNGRYQINSLSSNQGVRAAFIDSKGGRLWVEWREPINQDKDLSFVQPFFGSTRMRNYGVVLGSILLKTQLGDRRTVLQGILELNKKQTVWNVTVECLSKTGSFRVMGLPGGDTEPESTTSTTTLTTTTTGTTSRSDDSDMTDAPTLAPPSGPSCAVAESSTGTGVCTTKQKCPGSYKLKGCKAKGLVCCFD